MSVKAIDVEVGRRIRQRRRAVGATQAALAEAIGLTFQQVQKYEKGANRVSVSTLIAIAGALGTNIEHFTDGLSFEAVGSNGALASGKTPTLHSKEVKDLLRDYRRIGTAEARWHIRNLARLFAENESPGGRVPQS